MELSEDLFFPAGLRVHAAARVWSLPRPMLPYPSFPAADASRCITWVQSEVSVGTIHILVVVVVRCGTSRRGWSHKGSSEKTKGHPIFITCLENNARRACPSGSLSATPRARVRHSRHGSHRAIHHILRQGHRQGPGDLHRCARRTRPRASPSFPASQIPPHLGRTVGLPRELTLPPLPAHSAQVPSSPCGCSRRPSGSGSRIRATRYAPDTSRYIPRDATSRALVRSDAQNHSPAERIFPTSTKPNRCLRS